eukprot:TRINITY_DN17238_c0_g1_i4.p1 TRINITY_DN17238_c0_g1~~TRINITY_DN17238_c0_g1_i4.p1  ORF type:complete len:294 (-),score=50.91 TRINITY_DN17238_c0_g1_i4:88-969(-)
MADVAGTWHYSEFSGGRCQIVNDPTGGAQLSFKTITGSVKTAQLRQADDGWWYTENSKLRLHRAGDQLVLQRGNRSGWSQSIYAFASVRKASSAYLRRSLSNGFLRKTVKRADSADAVNAPDLLPQRSTSGLSLFSGSLQRSASGMLQRSASGLKDAFFVAQPRPSRQSSASSLATTDSETPRRTASETVLSIFVSLPKAGTERLVSRSPNRAARRKLLRSSSDLKGLFLKTVTQEEQTRLKDEGERRETSSFRSPFAKSLPSKAKGQDEHSEAESDVSDSAPEVPWQELCGV